MEVWRVKSVYSNMSTLRHKSQSQEADLKLTTARIIPPLRLKVTVTKCPPGCGNGICPRVFEDCLGLGCSVYCICTKSGCHKESSKRRGLSLLTSKGERKMKIRKNQKGRGAVSNQSSQPNQSNTTLIGEVLGYNIRRSHK
jgi:hypothetical protein